MYAIIEDSGTQIKVSDGDVIDIDARELDGAKTITFDRVLMISDAEKGNSTIGEPYVGGATVTADVVKEYRDRKLHVVRFKRRKGFHRKIGHRQPYVQVQITGINS